MSSIFGLEKLGGKTSTIDALSRDTFRDQLSACFKAGSDRLSNFNRTCSYQALIFSIAARDIAPINPSYELLCLLSEGYFSYRDIHCYSDTATMSVRKMMHQSTQFFAFNRSGMALRDDDPLSSAHYVVISWEDSTFGSISAFGTSFNLNCIVCVPCHAAIEELKRPFAGLASIQLFEDAEAFGRGFRNTNPSQGFMRMSRSQKLFEKDELIPGSTGISHLDPRIATVGHQGLGDARVMWMKDLTAYYPSLSAVNSDQDIPAAIMSADRIRMRNQNMRERQIEGISSYLHYIDYIFSKNAKGVDADSNVVFDDDEWIGVLKSAVFDPINLITQSDRCFLESASGFKYINVPGLDSGAIFAAITSAFLLSLMANNRSEVFMSYVPYGSKDILTNGDFDLGGYVNGAMWFSEKGPQTHPKFTTDLADKTWFGQLKINSRKAGERELIVDVVVENEVIGNEVILDLNKNDEDSYHAEEIATAGSVAPDIINALNWSMCHGHQIIKHSLTHEELYGEGHARHEDLSGGSWKQLSLERNKDGTFKVPEYLLASRW